MDPTANENALLSLAVLNVNWKVSHRSHFDNFVDFVVEALARGKAHGYSAADATRLVEEHFGFRIPESAVGSVIGRAVKLGRLERNPDGRVFPVAGHSSATSAETRAELEREQARLAASLIEAAASTFQLVWARKDAIDALLSYVARYARRLLRGALDGTGEIPIAAATPALEEVVVASWLRNVFEVEPELFKYFVNVVKGSILADATFSGHAGQVDEPFRDTTLFLDTPIILALLGLKGPEYETAVTQVLGQCKTYKARVACFEITVQEVRSVLYGAREGVSARRGVRSLEGIPIFDGQSHLTEADVLELAANLESSLASVGVSVEKEPEVDERTAIGLQQLEDELERKVQYNSTASPQIHDADAAAAVYYWRRGHRSDHLERARAVFVTSNSRVVRVVEDWPDFRAHQSYPIAISLWKLGTILWVKDPLKSPDMPKSRIIVDCLSVLAPDRTLLEAYLDEADRLSQRGEITSAQVAVMRYSQVAREALVRSASKHGGFAPEVAQDALAAAESAFRGSDKRQIEQLAAELEKANVKYVSLASRLDGFEKAQQARLDRIVRRADALRLATEVALWVGAGAVVFGGFYAMSGLKMFPDVVNRAALFVAPAGLFVAAVIALTGGVRGTFANWAGFVSRKYRLRATAGLSGLTADSGVDQS